MLDDALTPAQLMAALNIKPATYYKYKRLGVLDRFRLVPTIGPPRYSRKVVQAYLDREPTAATLRGSLRVAR